MSVTTSKQGSTSAAAARVRLTQEHDSGGGS